MIFHKIEAARQKRLSSAPLPRDPAPYTCSDLFRVQLYDHKANARCWTHRLSDKVLRQEPAVLKSAAAAPLPTGPITLGTGRPAAEFYPWSSLEMNHKNQISGMENGVAELSSICSQGEASYDLSLALNYGYAAGSPQLFRFITEHVEMIHDPPYKDWRCSLTCGSTSALDMILEILCNPGDFVLAEQYTYPGMLDAAKSKGLNLLGIAMDAHGLVPQALDDKLRSWDVTQGKKPSVLYRIATGHNPTGTTQSLERRKEIYQIAEDHDVLIIEDDPYFFLQLKDTSCESRTNDLVRYVEELPTSYLTLDVSGRVIRLDSTSKIVAPGLRCGWITACSQIIARFLAMTEVSTVSPSGVSQVMLYKLLDETWGHEGFLHWLNRLFFRYRERLNLMAHACTRHLSARGLSWVLPTEGMFLWIRICASGHDLTGIKSYDNIEDKVFAQARGSGVLVGKGSWFEAPGTSSHDIYFRFTFAAAPQENLVEAIRRFGNVLEVIVD